VSAPDTKPPRARKGGGRRNPAAQSRALVARALSRILDDGDTLDVALAPLDSAKLAPRDKGFARVMLLGALRHLGRCDLALGTVLDRPLEKAHPMARALLRCGAAQILFLGTPGFAAVSATTEAAKLSKGTTKFAGLINACLRRLTENADSLQTRWPVEDDWPVWLVLRWREQYGADTTSDMLSQLSHVPPTDLTPKSDAWAPPSDMPDAARLPTGSWRIPDGQGRVERWPGYDAGDWWVQDAAAALPVMLMGDVADKHVLDMCAAPGGKTMQLAAQGAHVTAIDRDAERVKRLQANLKRTGLSAECVTADAASYTPQSPPDAILLDAPCSATGTLRRHPDVAWHRTVRQISDMVPVQRKLVRQAADILKPGGMLVYCVCSLEAEEGAAMADWIKAEGLGLEPSPIGPDELPGLPAEAFQDGALRTLPHYWADRGGMDGFYVIRFLKRR